MTPGDSFYLYSIGTVSSAGLERCLDRAEVAGSNPARFTLRHKSANRRLFLLLSRINTLIGVPVKFQFSRILFSRKRLKAYFDPLRQVTEEHERRHAARRKLGDIFDLDIFTLPGWGG